MLADLCDTLAREPGFHGAPAAGLADLAAHCREPLRVAVTGDVSMGKSTLVNALLRNKRAATARAETTARVTWYRHPALAPSRVPDRSRHEEAILFPLADRLILVDTPGVNTGSSAQECTEEMLRGATRAAASTTVVLYLCGATVGAGARERFQRFADLTGGDVTRGLNVVLIGSKADEVDVPFPRIEENLLHDAGLPGACAVAVSQQLAETARCGLLDAAHLDVLAAVAADPILTAAAPYGWDMLRAMWADQGRERRELDALEAVVPTTFGVVAALPAIRAGGVTGVADLERVWEELSGLEALEALLDRMVAHGDALTVHAVTARLLRMAPAWGAAQVRRVRRGLAELTASEAFARVDRSVAALALDSPALAHVPPNERHTAIRALRGQPTGVSRDAVAEAWQERALLPQRSVLARYVAEIVVHVCLAEPETTPALDEGDPVRRRE